MIQQRTLPPDPSSAMAARSFARDVLRKWREGASVDVVQLLVSELVTNAVLHAGSKVEVSVRHRGEWLRVEVTDESPVLPGQRDFETDAATGRGLALVDMLADDWGVEPIPDDGKVVWFEVPATHADEGGAEDDTPRQAPAVFDDEVVIRLLNAPVQLFPAAQQHTEALLREYALMAIELTSGSTPPRLALDMRAVTAQIAAAAEAGLASVDLVVAAPDTAGPSLMDARDALAIADRLAADGQLLTAPALPEVRWCREWFLGEVIAQLAGESATPWTMAAIRTDARTPLDLDHRRVLDRLHAPVVVADDQNHIAYVNTATETLLGWSSGTLTNQRLTAIIPERLHEAHLSAYTRYQVTRQPRLLGKPVRVPARRRDGSEVEVELTLDAFSPAGGRQMFVGLLRPLGGEDSSAGVDERKWLRLVNDVLAEVAADENVHKRHGSLLALIAEHTDTAVGSWWKVDGPALCCIATWSSDGERFRAFEAATSARRFHAGEGLPGRVWSEQRAGWISDAVREANFPRASVALQHNLRTAFAFPIIREGRVTGVIELLTEDMRVEDETLLAGLETVGRALGLAAP